MMRRQPEGRETSAEWLEVRRMAINLAVRLHQFNDEVARDPDDAALIASRRRTLRADAAIIAATVNRLLAREEHPDARCG